MKRLALGSWFGFFALVVFLVVSLIPGTAFGQESRALAYQLSLPADVKKPDLPLSDKTNFGKISDKSVLLEVVLNPDGSVIGIEERILTSKGIKTSTKTYSGDNSIRSLLRYVADMARKKDKDPKETALADVDLMVHASPETPLFHVQRLMQIACEYGICINRFHFNVKDKNTGEKGILSYYLPCFYVDRKDPGEKEFLSRIHIVNLYNSPEGPLYTLEFPPGKGGEEKKFNTMAALIKEIDRAKSKNNKACFTLCLGGIPLQVKEKPVATQYKDFVELMTCLASVGADLKQTKTLMPELKKIKD